MVGAQKVCSESRNLVIPILAQPLFQSPSIATIRIFRDGGQKVFRESRKVVILILAQPLFPIVIQKRYSGFTRKWKQWLC